jgi:4'-phosphopantetheinyl transferase EntD
MGPTRQEAIVAALRDMFPPGVAVAVELLSDAADDLWPVERAAIAQAVPKRQAEFRAGRRAARRALADLRHPAVAVPMGADRAPVWPAGLFGSIAHAGGVALAVVSRDQSLGVDIEADTAIAPDLWPTICTAPELARLPPSDPGSWVCRVFAAKEAVFKAQRPDRRGMFGFDSVSIALVEGGFDAHFLSDAGAFPAGHRLKGRLATVEGMVLAGVTG